MRIHSYQLLATLALIVLCAGPANAQIVVNIDFNYTTNGTETYAGQGAYSDTGNNYWNVIQSNTINTAQVFKASDGTTDTGVTFTMASPGTGYNFSSGGSPNGVAGDLMQDYLYTFNASSDPVAFSIGGLSAGASYEIYIYSAVGGNNSVRNRQAVFTLDGVSENVNGYSSATSGSALYDAFVLGDNYQTFSITTTGTSIAGGFYAPSGGEAEFNGLQIVQVVPEPSTYAWFAGIFSLTACIVIRRRRSLGAESN